MAGKMDKTTKIVLAVVGSLGVLSAILGFSAEGTKLTFSDLRYYGGVCYYPPSPALGLGVCAVIFLIIGQVVFAVVGGCCGCCKSRAMPSETNRIIGLVCAVASWIAAVIAFALLVAGANSSGDDAREADMLGRCYVLKAGIFAGGAVLTLAATALALTSYIMLRSQPIVAAAPNTEGGEQLPEVAAAPNKVGGKQQPAGAAGIPMGTPQFPEQPRPEGHGQAPPPKFPQQPRPQGFGQAPPPKFLHKPRPQARPPTPPKYPQPHGQVNIEHEYEVELRVEGHPQPEGQNGCGIEDLHEGEAQTSGVEHFSDLPEGEAEAYDEEYPL